MSETKAYFSSDTQDKKTEIRIVEKTKELFSSALNLFKGKFERKNPEKEEEKQATEIAKNTLLTFMSGKIQAPIKTIYEGKNTQEISLADVCPKQATVLRIEGYLLHHNEKHFWFVMVKMPIKTHAFVLQTEGVDYTELRPRIKSHRLDLFRSYTIAEQKKPIPMKFFLHSLLSFPFTDEYEDYAKSGKIDIMHAGTPEQKTVSSRHSLLNHIFNQVPTRS